MLGYVTYFLSLLGIEGFFKASVALYCVMLASNLSAFALIEVVGRRPLLVGGMFALTAIELVSVQVVLGLPGGNLRLLTAYSAHGYNGCCG